MNSFFSFIIAHFQLIRRPNTGFTTTNQPTNQQANSSKQYYYSSIVIVNSEFGNRQLDVEMSRNIIACKGNDMHILCMELCSNTDADC